MTPEGREIVVLSVAVLVGALVGAFVARFATWDEAFEAGRKMGHLQAEYASLVALNKMLIERASPSSVLPT